MRCRIVELVQEEIAVARYIYVLVDVKIVKVIHEIALKILDRIVQISGLVRFGLTRRLANVIV